MIDKDIEQAKTVAVPADKTQGGAK